MAGKVSAGMTLIFRKSLHQAKITNTYLDPLVLPLYKLGRKQRRKAITKVTDQGHYHQCLVNYQNILSRAMLLNTQITVHGFRLKRSCETQFINGVHDLRKILNDGEYHQICYNIIYQISQKHLTRPLRENYASNCNTMELGVNYQN